MSADDRSTEQGYAPSTTEKRTKMLYGDHEDAAEPAYDDMYAGAAILDSTSTLHAVGVTGSEDNGGSIDRGADDVRRRIIETGIAGDDERLANRRQGGREGPLQNAEKDQAFEIGGQPAEQGGNGEHDDRAKQHGAPRKTPGQPAADRRRHRRGDDVEGHHQSDFVSGRR